MVSAPKVEGDDASIDALYVTPEQPHQQSLFAGPEIALDAGVIEKKVDAVYVTRFQKERWAEKDQPYPEDRPQVPQRAEIFGGQRAAPAAARRRARRLGRHRPARGLFRAGGLRRAGAHGADLAPARASRASRCTSSKAASSATNIRSTTSRGPSACIARNNNCIVHDPMEAQLRAQQVLRRERTPRRRASCAASIASTTSMRSWSRARRTNGSRGRSRRAPAQRRSAFSRI